MKIIIVGAGKVGRSIAVELSREDNDITVIDHKEDVVEELSNLYDLMGIVGNGASYSVQMEAGIEQADLLIAVTGSDELNLLCCLIARKAGNCHTIARVRNPEYSTELGFIKEELGLAMVINPEFTAAREISRVLKFPSAIEVNSFPKSRVDLLKFRITEHSTLSGKKLSELFSNMQNILICAIERGDELIIPDGSSVLHARDLVTIVGTTVDANEFFRRSGIVANQVRSILIVGGSSISYYLAQMLLAAGIRVKLIEKDQKRCEQLSEMLPKATIVHGDGTDRELLMEEKVTKYQSFAALTNIDEENILISLFVRKISNMKLITKINRSVFDEVIKELDLDTVIHPKDITTEHIVRYVRSMKNASGSNVETLHKIINGKAEALEFLIRGRSRVTDIPLRDLKIRSGILIASISRKGKVIIPGGSDEIRDGDGVVVITRISGLNDISDVLIK